MKISTQIFLGFAIVITLSLVDSYIHYTLSEQVNKNSTFLANSEAVIRNSSRIHKGIIDMQSAFRGYLLTGDESFLANYFAGIKQVPRLLKEERVLIKDSPSQLAKLDSINNLHRQWIVNANLLIEANREAVKSPQALPRYREVFENRFRKNFGKKINDQIGEKFREFDRFEYRKRELRRSMQMEAIERTKTFSLIFVILTIVIGLVSSIYIVTIIIRRINNMVSLAKNISNGEFTQVKDDKADELTSLSTSLNVMSGKLDRNIRELEKRNTELNQFAYVVSHDLKAPLRGIHNVVQWIEEDLNQELSVQMRKYLSIVRDRMRRMEDLIHGLLNYAQIAREKPLKEPVDLDVMLKDLTELIVPKSFEVQVDKMPVLNAERIRLQQVFSNLLSNSVKYSSATSARIHIGCEELENDYKFFVSDNGIGIAPEYHEKIFEVFQTLREKNEKESTGIGLSIVKKIIEDQHGDIEVHSDLGKGASFVFTWPKN
jgi:signal transduction histidine kinase